MGTRGVACQRPGLTCTRRKYAGCPRTVDPQIRGGWARRQVDPRTSPSEAPFDSVPRAGGFPHLAATCRHIARERWQTGAPDRRELWRRLQTSSSLPHEAAGFDSAMLL